jgi:predicted HTH transcriptional regulator
MGHVSGEELGYKWGNKLGYKLGKSEQLVLEAILAYPHITITKLSILLGIATTTVEYNIYKLKAKNLLDRIVSKKKGHWKVNI